MAGAMLEQAEQLLDKGIHPIKIADEINHQTGLAKGGWVIGGLLYDRAEYDQAIQSLLPSIAIWRELGKPYELARTLNTLAACLIGKGEFRSASEILQETAAINRDLGYRRGLSLCLIRKGADHSLT